MDAPVAEGEARMAGRLRVVGDRRGSRRGSGRDAVAVAEAPVAHSGCVHHWVLGDPQEGAVPGNCRRCGERRAFPASPDSTDRFDDYREVTSPSTYMQDRRSA
jgi:hypothetical protein